MAPLPNQDDQHPPIKILLAEDHEVVRNGLRALLDTQPDLKVIAEAPGGLSVLEHLAHGLLPDVILTDINMPGMDGVELIAKLKKDKHPVKLVVLSMLDNEKFVVQALKAGADGYLLKSVSSNELIFAIKHVMTGAEYVCSEIAMRVMKRLVKAPVINPLTDALDLELTDRDREVLSLMAEGYTNQEIADKLFTGKRTVEGYRQSLMNRTGSRNSAALIKFAVLNGLLD